MGLGSTEEILQKQPCEGPGGVPGCGALEGIHRRLGGRSGLSASLGKAPGVWPAGCNRIPALASTSGPGTPSQGGPAPGPLPLEGVRPGSWWGGRRGQERQRWGGGGGHGRVLCALCRRPWYPGAPQLLASVSHPAGRGRGPAGLYIFLTGPSSEARKKQQGFLPSWQPIC